MSGAIEAGRTYYRAMFETLTVEESTDACSGEGDADAAPRTTATKLHLSELRDGHGQVHAPQSYSIDPPDVAPSHEYTKVKVSVALPSACMTNMLLATLLDDAGAPASDQFTIYVSMPQ
jgi:hypothetical protein